MCKTVPSVIGQRWRRREEAMRVSRRRWRKTMTVSAAMSTGNNKEFIVFKAFSVNSRLCVCIDFSNSDKISGSRQF